MIIIQDDKINLLKEYYNERLNDIQKELIMIQLVIEQIKEVEGND